MPARISLHEQIAEIRRELAMRRTVYPRRVAARRMSIAQSRQQITVMEAVLATLQGIEAEQRPGLFGSQ